MPSTPTPSPHPTSPPSPQPSPQPTATPAPALRTPESIIAQFGMQPIPGEGAWFAPGPRTQELSSITVLLTDRPDGFSALHKLAVDEGWQWLDGAPVALLRLRRSGRGVVNLLDETNRQLLVRRGDWQAAAPMGAWSLVACWCSPAFRDQHFTLGDADELCAAYPTFEREIRAMTRPVAPSAGETPATGMP